MFSQKMTHVNKKKGSVNDSPNKELSMLLDCDCEDTLNSKEQLKNILLSDIPTNPNFPEFLKWLQSHSNYNGLPQETKTVIEDYYLNELRDVSAKQNKTYIGFLKFRLDGMTQSKGVTEEIKTYNRFRKFVSCLLVKQNGIACYAYGFTNFSKFTLEFTSGKKNQWSCERLNECNKYSSCNIVLNTLHFQSSSLITDKLLHNDNIYYYKDIPYKPTKKTEIENNKIYKEKINKEAFDEKNLPSGCNKSKKNFEFSGKIVLTTKNRTKDKAFEEIKNHYIEQRPNEWKDEYNMNNLPNEIKFNNGKKPHFRYGRIVLQNFDDFIKKYIELHPKRWEEQLNQLRINQSCTEDYNYYISEECTDNNGNITKIFRKVFKSNYTNCIIKKIGDFKIHELQHSLADTIEGTAQWSLEKVSYVNEPRIYQQEDSSERVEQIERMKDELNNYLNIISKLPKNTEPDYFPTEGKTGIVYKLISMANDCFHRTVKRCKKGRNHKNETKHKLFQLVVEQFCKYGMRCAYSGIKMSFSELSYNFAMSVERLDESEGYVEGNVLLVCKEFNTGLCCQWSVDFLNSARGI